MARLRRMDDRGAIHLLEAILATILLVATLAYMNANVPAVKDNVGSDDLRPLSGDILNVLMYRNNTVEDPGLAHALSSEKEWDNHSVVMGENIEAMLPEGMHYFMQSPYGEIGEMPPSYENTYSRPFEVFCEDEDSVEECDLVIWR